MKRTNKNPSFDLTVSAETGGYPSKTLTLIDRAVAVARQAAYACRDAAAWECFEFALALGREGWIGESGQDARGAEKVIADVKWGLRLIAAVFEKGAR